ncbi:hypothetical protein [Nocardioides sp.]|uniref:hypothetical protein n=1 Tax=Nocardioides sp. TaxID=35761 RepID=UPI00262FA1AA|nr:hypothetical protein [Nocardioides sp.]
MKVRSLMAAGALVAAGLTLTAPVGAYAASTDPVTNVQASALQTLGTPGTWTVTASWTANPDATGYTIRLASESGEELGTFGPFTTTSATFTTTKLGASGQSYRVFVSTTAPNAEESDFAPFDSPQLDTTAPVATYKVNRSSAVLVPAAAYSSVRSTSVVLTQASADDTIASRQIVPGDGSAAVAWPLNKPTATIRYTKAGVFTPKVRVADIYGNVAEIAAGKVSVIRDTVAPKVSIMTPSKATKLASWKVVRGTASDAGTGVLAVGAFVMQKRAGVWWAYDFATKKWLKGYRSITTTENRTKANAAFVTVRANGTWVTPAIKGLKKGSTIFEAAALDLELNQGFAQVGPRTLR